MLRMSRKQDYAVLILTYISTRQGLDTSARTIAEQFNLSLPYISKILKELTRYEILKSERGSQGGYSLQVAPAELSLADILKALSEPFTLTRCTLEGGEGGTDCEAIGSCFIQAPMQRLNNKINDLLKSTTLADLQAMATTSTPTEN